jgi:hypothetical protein
LEAADSLRLTAASVYPEDDLTALLTLSVAYLLRLQLSEAGWNTLMAVFARIADSIFDPVSPAIDARAYGSVPFATEAEFGAISSISFSSMDLPEVLRTQVETLGLRTWGNLASFTELDTLLVVRIPAESLVAIGQLWDLRHIGERLMLHPDEIRSIVNFGSFDTMVDSYIRGAVPGVRQATIVSMRSGLTCGRKMTLDEIGQAVGLTKERVRQLLPVWLPYLTAESHVRRLSRLWTAVDRAIDRCGGITALAELAEQIAAEFGWPESPSMERLAAVVSLSDRWTVDAKTHSCTDVTHRCRNCGYVQAEFAKALDRCNEGISIAELRSRLGQSCLEANAMCKVWGTRHFSPEFIAALATKSIDAIATQTHVYPRQVWEIDNGSLTTRVGALLRSVGSALPLREIQRRLSSVNPSAKHWSVNHVHAALDRSSDVVLWGWGQYIHREFVRPDAVLLDQIQGWIIGRIGSGDIPFISANGAFTQFSSECTAAGIPNEHALYTALKEFGNGELSFPRAPYIYLSAQFTERMPTVVAIEEFIHEAGEPVPYSEVKQFALGGIGLKEFQFGQCVNALSKVLRMGSGAFVHVDSLDLDLTQIQNLLDHIDAVLQSTDHISVERIYREKAVTCRMMNVDSPRLLYSILRMREDGFDTSHYPVIGRAVKVDESRRGTGIRSEIVGYVQKLGRPCALSELESRFVEQLGYKQTTVYSAVASPDIVRYGLGSVVHLDSLGWTELLQQDLEAVARRGFEEAENAGYGFANAATLLESKDLPPLSNGTIWTQVLVTELLVRSGSFRVLGTGRTAFVAMPNQRGIETFEDLVADVLATEFEGAADVEALGEYLRQRGVIKKGVLPSMLGRQQKVHIVGLIAALGDNSNRAQTA